MTPREIVGRTIRFQGAERMPVALPPEFGNDFHTVRLTPNPDARCQSGVDEWGSVWENIGVCQLGEVKHPALPDWADFGKMKVPDIREPRRFADLREQVRAGGDKFILGNGIALYERVHFIRGLENTWMDIYDNEEKLRGLIDILVDMNLYTIGKFAEAGVDGLHWCDDWGLQDRLMISPVKWREIWKPAYARVYRAAHEAGLLTFLHSCGYISDILDDLIEAGLDVIQMDQQENMGLSRLSDRFRGRITFWNPVDIQQTMNRGTPDAVRAYARNMVRLLGTPSGGFIAKAYNDPVGAGHKPEKTKAMAEEFLDISKNYQDAATGDKILYDKERICIEI